jgi:AcrR family transcriptional regulator
LRALTLSIDPERLLQIVEAAEGLWRKTSYADFSMSGLAEASGSAKGTLYLYFATKESRFFG